MPNYTAMTLSAATSGGLIKITTTATPGVTIHTATSSDMPEGCDELWLWAGSTHTAAVNATLHVTALATEQDRTINFRVPAAYNGPISVLAGHRLCDSVVVTATASVADRVVVWGNVNRISGQGT